MISNQVCFSQSIQKFFLKLVNKQIYWLLRYVIKQDFNFANQSCKLHLKNKKLIIMFHVKSFSFFHVSLALQVILIVFVQKAE